MKNKFVAILLITVMAVGVMATGCGDKKSKGENLVTNKTTEAVSEVPTEKATQAPVATTEASTQTATQPVVASEAPAAPETTTMYAQKKVNVRNVANATATALGYLSTNDAVVVVGSVSADGWYTVNYNNQTGYVKSEFLGAGTVATTTAPATTKSGTTKKSSAKKSTTTSGSTTQASGNSSAQSSGESSQAASSSATTSQASSGSSSSQSSSTPSTSSSSSAAATTPSTTQDSSSSNTPTNVPTNLTQVPSTVSGEGNTLPGAAPAPSPVVVAP